MPWDLDATFDLKTHPFNPFTVSEASANRLFNFAVQLDLNTQLTNLRNFLTSDFNATTLDSIALPWIETMREAYASDPILRHQGQTIDSEYAKLKADALSWWNSLDQELTSRGY